MKSKNKKHLSIESYEDLYVDQIIREIELDEIALEVKKIKSKKVKEVTKQVKEVTKQLKEVIKAIDAVKKKKKDEK